ncbi:MAG: holo-ACP synthase [Candidatus Neomarinimicrobiota bacterium]|nr:holo-ACP synthase [Candidatus Neomarinimicrobiota bacterium]
MVLESKVGTDIVEVSRIGTLCDEQGGRFYRHIFTDSEVEWCKERAVPQMHLAGRFAAKEAVKKALLAFGEKEIPLNSIEILRERNAPPQVTLHLELNRTYECQVSISHTDSLATAVAIVTSQ